MKVFSQSMLLALPNMDSWTNRATTEMTTKNSDDTRSQVTIIPKMEKPVPLETFSKYEMYFSKLNFVCFLLCCNFPTILAELTSTLFSLSVLSLAVPGLNWFTCTCPKSGKWIVIGGPT